MSPMALDSSDVPIADGASAPLGALEPLCGIITPMGMLGYGFDEGLLTNQLDKFTKADPPFPVAVIMDSGSTDSGPSKLALGSMTCPEASYRRDLTKLVRAVINYKVPVLISSAGGDGSNEHVDLFVDLIKEICLSLNCPRALNILALYAEISKDLVAERLDAGQITGCGDKVPALTHEITEKTPRILAQMGPEPMLKALQADPDYDIVIAGRAYDPAPFVAFCALYKLKSSSSSPALLNSLSDQIMGGFYHMGKIMECGGLCATPKSAGAAALVYKDGTFDISAMDPSARCTPLSVAAHTLYEKARPDILHGPGGTLDLGRTTYEQLPDEVTIRVRGGRFEFSIAGGSPFTIKLEGARVVGARTLFMGSFKDPILTSQIHEYLETGKRRCAQQHQGLDGKWQLDFHVYSGGANGASGASPEVFIVGEVLADTPTLSKSVASTARVYCSHGSYAGQMATSGNFAFGLGGLNELDVGPCCEFSIYHLMNLKDGEETGHRIADNNDKVVSLQHSQEGLFPWQKIVTQASTSSHGNSSEVNGKTSGGSPLAGLMKSNGGKKSKKLIAPFGTLKDVATVIRSKNAGPFEITFDVMFDEPAVYQAVKASGVLSQEIVSSVFGRSPDEVVWCGFFDQALAFKLTLPRTRGGKLRCSGGYMEDDVHGSQQYLPLMTLPLNGELIKALEKIVS